MNNSVAMNKEVRDRLLEKAKRDKVVSSLLELKQSFRLVGGAVADIYYDKRPRDYDFDNRTDFDGETLNKDEQLLQYMYESSFSTTFSFRGETLQILKKNTNQFPYRVQMITLKGDKDGVLSVENLCPNSLVSKRLIPNRSIVSPDFLLALPKWLEKGFTIHNIEYFDALNRLLTQYGEKELQKKS